MDEDDVRSERIIHQPPSCIEFCPANPSVFVLGTYKLEDCPDGSSTEEATPQSRSGRIEVYQIRKKSLSPGFGVSECIKKHDLPDCAVLDVHFHPQDATFFAVCTSASQMVFFRLGNVEGGSKGAFVRPSILEAGSIRLDDDDTVLATSFTWDLQPNTAGAFDISFAVAFSSGKIRLLGVNRAPRFKASGRYDFQIIFQASIDPAHTLEAWTVAFADLPRRAEQRMLLTGGDDSTLALHCITYDVDKCRSEATQLFQNRKSHAAGVTALLPIHEASHGSLGIRVFVTGSYDEHIRVFTVQQRPPYKQEVVAELCLGGGVWRLRTLAEPLLEEAEGCYVCCVLILASCMHAGVRILRITRRLPKHTSQDWCNWEIDVVGQFTKVHESMCYGADSVSVRRLSEDDRIGIASTNPLSCKERSDSPCSDEDSSRDFVVVSTSFYDKRICVWRFYYGMNTFEKADAEHGLASGKSDTAPVDCITLHPDADGGNDNKEVTS